MGAQERSVEISAGYSFLHEGGGDGSDGLSVPAGWYASGGGYLTHWLGIVGEVNGHHKTFDDFGGDVKTSIHLYGAGPKLALRLSPRFTPYVQALFGGGRTRASTSRVEVTLSGFAYQPSAGIEINNSSETFGLRLAVARASVRSEGEWLDERMFMAGVVFRR